ncbi:hypothetical protein HK102_006888 [Quaeritorhiza haematococci]|nr:hypothetical protein HK102_006888 [Quaeritorhiza haematococci]
MAPAASATHFVSAAAAEPTTGTIKTTPHKQAPASHPPSHQHQQIIHHPIPTDPFDETVYNLLPLELPPQEKPPTYKSVYAKLAKKEYKDGKKATASIGPAKVQQRSAKEFLKKDEGSGIRAVAAKTYRADRSVRKDPLPKSPGQIPEPSKKDFVKINALDNIQSVAKKQPQAPPSYLAKKDYGKTPNYLQHRKEELHERKIQEKQDTEQARLDAVRESQLAARLVPLPEDERVKLLAGLKANWEKLNSDYQKLSLTVDTVPKITRKVNMEQQLKQLEDSMAKLSKPNILVDFNEAFAMGLKL